MAAKEQLPLPPGSENIAGWARQHRFGYEASPDETWFRRWEPFDTMVSAEAYYNAVTWSVSGGTVTLAEPWLAPVGAEPLGRTALFFVQHGAFVRRAAARGGEHFNTRLAFLENAPPPEVKLGDPEWDRYMISFAASPGEAVAAFPVAARRLLASWGFVGHVEVRPGGLVFNHVPLRLVPPELEGTIQGMQTLIAAFATG